MNTSNRMTTWWWWHCGGRVDRLRPYFPTRHLGPLSSLSSNNSAKLPIIVLSNKQGLVLCSWPFGAPFKTRMINFPMSKKSRGCRNDSVPFPSFRPGRRHWGNPPKPSQLYVEVAGAGFNCLSKMLERNGERERSWVLDGRVVRRAGRSCWESPSGFFLILPLFLRPASELFHFFVTIINDGGT